GEVYAAGAGLPGSGGVILRTLNGGAWQSTSVVNSAPNGGINAVWPGNQLLGLNYDAVADAGRASTNPTGDIWNFSATAILQNLNATWEVHYSDLFGAHFDTYSVGDGGTILHTSAAHPAGELMSSGTTHNLRAVWASGPNDVY